MGYDANDRYADLMWEQWEDYKQRYMPVQEKFLEEVYNEELLDEMLGNVTVNNQKAQENAAQMSANTRAMYGIEQDANSQQAFDAQAEQQAALSTAQQQNAARTHYGDRQEALITGGGTAPRNYMGG